MLGLSMHNSHSLRALLILDIQGFSPSLAAVQMGGSTQAETGTSWGGEREWGWSCVHSQLLGPSCRISSNCQPLPCWAAREASSSTLPAPRPSSWRAVD